MYFLILILPFFSFILSGMFGWFFGRNIAVYFSSSFIFLGFVMSVFIWYGSLFSSVVTSLNFFNWVFLDYYSISFGLFFDSLTSIMLLIITGISFLVHIYSLGYMSHDPYICRFVSYLSLFTFFMVFLVTSDNLLQMFFGWEGVGLCSYLLINFWHTRILANKAALKAMFMNRIADVFLLLGIVSVLFTFGSINYSAIFGLVDSVRIDTIFVFNICINKLNLICFLFLIGAAGKSAQLGLHTWLPDAMEGPTPVSSLLHAATMVTAGVFLLLRLSPILEFADNILFIIAIIGGFTAFFSAIIGVFQFDIKKIIAYSTCSQLGYMFFSCGLSLYNIAIFHLFNHAFFKALLFLSAGSLIHVFFDEQDIRRMGNVIIFLPFTYFCIFLGSLAIMGFPFLTGFYSKDLLLELTFVRYLISVHFIHFLGVASAFFTSVYSFRLLFYVFLSDTNFFRVYTNAEENFSFMSFSMFVLGIFSMFVGYIFSDLTMGLGTAFWSNSLFILPSHFSQIDGDFLHPLIKNLPILVSVLGFVLFLLLNNLSGDAIWLRNISTFFNNAGFFNLIYNKLFLDLFEMSYILPNKLADKGLIEFFGPFGFYLLFRKFSLFLKDTHPILIFFQVSFFMFVLLSIFLLFICNFHYLILFTFNQSVLSLFSLLVLILYFELYEHV